MTEAEPTSLADDATTAPPPRLRWMRGITTTALIVGALTTFDGLATWYEVEVLDVAEEANPTLQAIEAAIGFTPTMALRIILGIALLIGVVLIAKRARERLRRFFLLALIICAVFYVMLGMYHAIILWNFAI